MINKSALRSHLAKYKKLLTSRPIGLKHLGANSWVISPRRIEGKKYISIGRNSVIMSKSNICALAKYGECTYSPSIAIGDNVYIGHHVWITAIGSIAIGDGCVFSEHVYVTDFFHGFSPERGLIMEQGLETKGGVFIGTNCFLGFRVAVMPGVVLGDWCIVGANSVVTHSFPPYSMIAGSPAQLIKTYSHEQRKWVPASKGAREEQK
jgi:acetyltransferase-like isoleucine patch superfamily enzyme